MATTLIPLPSSKLVWFSLVAASIGLDLIAGAMIVNLAHSFLHR